MMKKYFAVIILACCLTACGSSTGAADKQQSTTTTTVATTTAAVESEPDSEPEETTTTTAAVESEPDSEAEDSSKAETTTAPAEDKPAAVTTFDTSWTQRYTIQSVIGTDTHVYAAPSKSSEKIGDLRTGDVVFNVGYANAAADEWVVIEWNNSVGFVYCTDISGSIDDEPLYDEPVYEDPANFDEPVQDNTTVEDNEIMG